MKKANAEIRALMHENHIPAWAIAEKLNCHENTILRRLRKEISETEKRLFINIIEELAMEDTIDKQEESGE